MTNRKELGKELNLEIDFIPESNRNRPQTKITPQYITIHNTDNTARGANSLAHAKFVKRRDCRVSWHYTVDDLLCVKHLPLNEVGWHAASSEGNRKSIGIEICMHRGIDQAAANERAAILTAILMYDLNIPLERVVTHHHWSGKNCPRLLLDDGKLGRKWQQFLDRVASIHHSIDEIDEKERTIREIFADDNEEFAEWSKIHGQATEASAYCSVPVVAERTFSSSVNATRQRLIRLIEKKWVNQTILHYYFFDSSNDGRTVGTDGWQPWATSEAEKNVVRNAFKVWQEVGIGLEFQEVNSPNEAEIRIGFERGDGAWSYIGRDVLNIGRDQRTMNFGWDLTQDPREIDTAVHEIGHTMGLLHEHQNPHAGIKWNEEAVYAALAEPPNCWSRETTYHNIIRKIAPDLVQGSSWDADSVMHYPFAAGLIDAPEEYRQGISPTPGLSARDREWVRKLYPPSQERYQELRPFEAVKLAIAPGEQRNFSIEPEATRYYNLQTFGVSDSVMVVFEEINGEPRYLSADDDSGEDYNAQIRIKLFQGKHYILRVRLYYSDRADETTVMMW